MCIRDRGNNTLMGLNVMLHTSETDLSIEDLYGEPVVCISVIDESSPSQDETNSDWNSFRTNYPSRPFYLLQPTNNNREFEDLRVPVGVSTTDPVGSAPNYGLLYSEVNRDNESVSSASDWFTICGLPATTILLA